MKTCEACEKEFELNKGRGGQNRKLCYDCMPMGLDKTQRNKRRREVFAEKCKKEKLELGCAICGYDKCSKALEWHHPNKDKDDTPANLIRISWERYKAEAEKCTLLCSNCHRELHEKIDEQ